jgi:hypothetical protein
MRNLLSCSSAHQLTIQLPEFCDVLSFRLMHLAIMQKTLITPSKLSINYYTNLFLTN